MSKKCVAIRHVAVEDLGSFAEPIEALGFKVSYIDAPVASKDDFLMAKEADLLVVLGGPIGVYDEEIYPFLKIEQNLLQERLSERKPTLGICLGAQLMVKALGAKVYPSGIQEVGWFPIKRDPALPIKSPAGTLFQEEPSIMMFHWHGDTFDLPEGAVRIASSDRIAEQGFTLGSYAVAFQFHPEITEQALELWLVTHAHELASSKEGAQRLVEKLRQDTKVYGAELKRRGQNFIESWLKAQF